MAARVASSRLQPISYVFIMVTLISVVLPDTDARRDHFPSINVTNKAATDPADTDTPDGIIVNRCTSLSSCPKGCCLCNWNHGELFCEKCC